MRLTWTVPAEKARAKVAPWHVCEWGGVGRGRLVVVVVVCV